MVQLVFPMIALGFVTNIFQRGAASMGRLNYILDAKPSIHDAAVPRPRAKQPEAPMRGEIEFRHLNFSYPTAARAASRRKPTADSAGTPVLARHQPARPGRLDAGHRRPHRQRQEHARGAGRPALGSAAGHAAHRRPLHSRLAARQLRRAIGFVPQDTYLFSETVRENIAFGVDDCR